MGYIKFIDAVDFTPCITDEVKDFYAQNPANGQNVQPLKVRIAATHAGKITRNNGFYLPHKMKDGVPTWTGQYPKPIQVHHEEKTDPIGRVVAAAYVDTSTKVRDSFIEHNILSVKDSAREVGRIFDGFVKGTLTRREIVDVANRYFIQDARMSEDPNYEGLGYIEIVASITDPAAIQRILDGRYLTGSVGASTNQAVCSVCRQDWADDGQCDHKPGKVYDDVRCVLIAGDLNYDEYSFVNKPADRHSRVIEVNVNGVKDFVHLDAVDSIPEISLISDKSKEHKMAEEDKKVEVQDELKPIRDFFGADYDEIVGDDEWGTEYVKMMYVLIEDAEESQKEALGKEIKDKVIKAAERRKLSSKTFCGPGKSYPVPDCAHARSAVAYAKKYGHSPSIIACAKRKAKRLGCPFSDSVEDSVSVEDITSEGKYDLDYFDSYSSKKLLKMRIGLDKAIKDRGLTCSSCEEMAKTIDAKAIDSALAETLAEKAKLLDAVRTENHALHLDLENLNHSIADTTAELRSLQYQQITDYRRLNSEDVKLEDVTNELKTKTGAELKVMVKELCDKIDIKKITDNLYSGLARKPEGKVEDPTTGVTAEEVVSGTAVKGEAGPSGSKFVDEATQKAIRLTYFNLRRTKGAAVADEYIKDCVAKGFVSSDWSVTG